MPSHARELLEHFKTEGTPVMIGNNIIAMNSVMKMEFRRRRVGIHIAWS